MEELYAQELEDLRTNGVPVGGITRPVHMTLMGDYSFTTTFDGHAGATFRFPCRYCSCIGRLAAAIKRLLPNYNEYGSIQDGSGAGRMPRTLEQKQAMASLHASGPLATMADPPVVSTTLSFERLLLMVFASEDIVPIPLHITLGVSPWMLFLGVEAVAFDSGAARAQEYAVALTPTLRRDVGVSPAPYWGGTFE